jgi:hypothetical protein
MGNTNTGFSGITGGGFSGFNGGGFSPDLAFMSAGLQGTQAPPVSRQATDADIQQLGQLLAQLYPNKQITITRGNPAAPAPTTEVTPPATPDPAAVAATPTTGQTVTDQLGLPEGQNLMDIFRNSIADQPTPLTTGVTVNEETGEATTGLASIDNGTFANGILEVNAFDQMQTINQLTGGRAYNDKTLAMVNQMRADAGLTGTVQEEIAARKIGFDGRPQEESEAEAEEA